MKATYDATSIGAMILRDTLRIFTLTPIFQSNLKYKQKNEMQIKLGSDRTRLPHKPFPNKPLGC